MAFIFAPGMGALLIYQTTGTATHNRLDCKSLARHIIIFCKKRVNFHLYLIHENAYHYFLYLMITGVMMKELFSRQTVLPGLSALTLALIASQAYASMSIQPVLTDMPPSEKPYQMTWVGADENVRPELRNSVYVASFGSSSGTEG
ncbi:hypothetical protein P8F49_004282, partial [Salmonella enterica]|nr:hypothetical protein [Salmonella enterica]EBA8602302.1 hypothetical protein [Salmonella enterica]EEP7758017.1 hypothetical protein [Salmonella enterica]EFS3135219.1 hypothetical protein [Salmonella enterica]EGL5807784.1 hypothetical protein [Salmonella enterica]